MRGFKYSFESGIKEIDSFLCNILSGERERQKDKIILIPSESICSKAVIETLATPFSNIYAEGYPPRDMLEEDEERLGDIDFQLARYRRYSDRRFYRGCEYANFVESIAKRRAAELFVTKKNPPDNIFVNVQPLSGAAANNAVYTALLEPGDVIMGMSLMHGGHLTHGSEFNRSGKSYQAVSYEVSPSKGKLDYKEIMKKAEQCKPKIIVAGYTSYPWAPDWKMFREICDAVGAFLFADISHPAGLVVAGVYPNPIDYADVVTFTTHKTLFGPRGAVIMTTKREISDLIDQAVFPGEQGGPHINKIAAMAVAFRIAMTEEYKIIQRKIVDNACLFASSLKKNDISLAYGGTDTHLMVIDLRSIKSRSGFPLKGEIAVRLLDLAGIVANKNTIPGDVETAEASGVRIGTPWITQRGITQKGIEELSSIIAEILRGINPFTYRGLTGDLPRGKVELRLLEEAKKRVKFILDDLEPIENYSGEAGCSETGINLDEKRNCENYSELQAEYNKNRSSEDVCIFLIRGQRGAQFCDQISTNKIYTSKEGECIKTFILDVEGKLFAPAVFKRIERSKWGEERFFVAINSDFKNEVYRWIQGLSDGYIAFDPEDIYRKVEGPVVIEEVSPDEVSENEISKNEVSFEHLKNKELISEDIFKELKFELLNMGRFQRKSDAAELYSMYQDYFDISKPYFVGQSFLRSIKRDSKKKLFQYNPLNHEIKRCVLYSQHIALGASMVEFAGWSMPVRYQGIVEEHRAVRENGGLFDISHMGIIEVEGEYATHFLDMVTTNYVWWLKAGESQYSFLLDVDGKVIDDIMVYKRSDDRYMVVVNAANAEKDLMWLKAVNTGEYIIDRSDPAKKIMGKVKIRDLKNPSSGEDALVDIALQGPKSLSILKEISVDLRVCENLQRLEKNNFIEAELSDIRVIVSRTGYTGEEYGYELFVHPSRAESLWNMILNVGKEMGIKPAGLGARDSLRIEAGLPLYGHELSGPNDISPLEAGFGPYVKFHKPFFIGREAVLEKWHHYRMEVVRFKKVAPGMKMSREGDLVISKRMQKVLGIVTSCALGMDGVQVGMAYIDRRFAKQEVPIAVMSRLKGGKGKPPAELEVGDSIPLADDAMIVSRFFE